MLADSMPIIIGVGQVSEKPTAELSAASTPLDLMEQAVDLALTDAGLSRHTLAKLDELVVVQSFREFSNNSPNCLAQRLDVEHAAQWLQPTGGNGPQSLVNRYFESIAKGQCDFVLLSGAEAMNTSHRYSKAGEKIGWDVKVDHDAKRTVKDGDLVNAQEIAHGLYAPSSAYALMENALRGSYGSTIDDHQQVLGELFAKFTDVASTVPTAWYKTKKTAEEIATATADNRYVGWPYTKCMNAMNQINQSATLLLCSVGFAKQQGISEDKWIYLHGCADISERGFVSDRVNYHSSPAINVMGKETFAMADMSIADIDYFDIYSCFPSVVQITTDELGIAKDDPRALTVTGGLPFHGGAGNNYVMNSIVTMIDKLRVERGKFGLITANGGFLSKHAAGIYSTTATTGDWKRNDPASYQHLVDDLSAPVLDEKPEGEAIIESYTVAFGRDNKPLMGIVIGRLGDGSDPLAARFISNTPNDPALLEAMTKEDFLNRKGTVVAGHTNIFTPV